MRHLALLPPLLLLLLAPGPASAWSGPGHQLVGAIAEERLTPAARALVEDLAGEEPLSSPRIARWADGVKDRETRPWHYVNIPFSAAGYDAARDCPRGACAVEAFRRAEATLRDRRAGAVARADALRWLVHLAGDLHQPLHAGDGRDRGGNDLLVRVRRRRQPTNLHRVWDVDVVEPIVKRRGAGRAALALLAQVPPAQLAAWAAQRDPAAWANESSREARAVYQALGRAPGDRGVAPLRPWEYEEAERPRVEAALVKAGVRLAAALNELAGRP